MRPVSDLLYSLNDFQLHRETYRPDGLAETLRETPWYVHLLMRCYKQIKQLYSNHDTSTCIARSEEDQAAEMIKINSLLHSP
jgi:spermidine synthase